MLCSGARATSRGAASLGGVAAVVLRAGAAASVVCDGVGLQLPVVRCDGGSDGAGAVA